MLGTLKEVKDIEEISEKILSLSTPEKLWQRAQELEKSLVNKKLQ